MRNRKLTLALAAAGLAFATGFREQVWHYPSRAECMVCHSRAANFVLGLSSLQMNKIHDYGGCSDNQLRELLGRDRRFGDSPDKEAATPQPNTDASHPKSWFETPMKSAA